MEVQVIDPLNKITVYQLMRLNQYGTFEFKAPDATKKAFGGMWADLSDIQHEQMIEGLKGNQWRVLKIDWTL